MPHRLPSIGDIPLRAYIRMVSPGSLLIGKRSLTWMCYAVFVAGVCAGLVVGRCLA